MSSNKRGFEHALFLTPPRLNYTDCTTTPNIDESKVVGAIPYRSPSQLPSVSPLLKQVVVMDLPLKRSVSGGSPPHPNAATSQEDELLIRDSMSVCKRLDLDDSSELNFEELNKCINEMVYDTRHPGSANGLHEPFTVMAGLEGRYKKPKTPPARQEPISPIVDDNSSETTEESGFHLVAVKQQVNAKREADAKGAKPKKADWVCPKCNNLNYSFRKFCNRCQLLR
jgi:hypothetical protein